MQRIFPSSYPDPVQTVVAEEIIPKHISGEIPPMLTLLPLSCESSAHTDQAGEIAYSEPDLDPAPEQEEEEPARWWEEESDDDPELLLQENLNDALRCEELWSVECSEQSIESNRGGCIAS